MIFSVLETMNASTTKALFGHSAILMQSQRGIVYPRQRQFCASFITMRSHCFDATRQVKYPRKMEIGQCKIQSCLGMGHAKEGISINGRFALPKLHSKRSTSSCRQDKLLLSRRTHGSTGHFKATTKVNASTERQFESSSSSSSSSSPSSFMLSSPLSSPDGAFSSSDTDTPGSSSDSQQKPRMDALHQQLTSLGIDAQDLANAVLRSVTTTDGYDSRYGKSAIRAYRSYMYPRRGKIEKANKEDIMAAATRCARQIDFLAKRHRSHETEWVRHTDTTVDAITTERTTFPLVLVLDNVRSAFNVGSIFRSADACGCSEVITTGITPHPNGSGSEKLSKSALGADLVVSTRHFDTTKEALDALRMEAPNIMLIGMETTARSRCYTDALYPPIGCEEEKGGVGVALFLGNEVTGVDTDVLPLLDEVVEIPMFGAKNSLNIAASAPVVMYEILRQWGVMKPS